MNKDFYKYLYESLCDNDEVNSNNSNTCLISGNVLDDKIKIKLLCNHSFDYSSLLKEVYIRKHKVICDVKIPRNCIQCPYCRNIQTGILPYREGFEKLMFVNIPNKYVMKTNKCCRIMNSGSACGKPSVNEKCSRCEKYESKPKCTYIMKRGNRKGQECGKPYLKINKYCSLHSLKMQTNANDSQNKEKAC